MNNKPPQAHSWAPKNSNPASRNISQGELNQISILMSFLSV